MTHIELVYFDAGGGHRSAAVSLQDVIHRKGLPWRVDLTNLQTILNGRMSDGRELLDVVSSPSAETGT